MQTVYQQSE